jgi:hypothetical protein
MAADATAQTTPQTEADETADAASDATIDAGGKGIRNIYPSGRRLSFLLAFLSAFLLN